MSDKKKANGTLSPMLTCTACRDPKPPEAFHRDPGSFREGRTYRCAECRSDAYFARRYRTVCAQCLRHRPVHRDGVCRGCHAEAGLRVCLGPCRALLPILLAFYDGKSRCKRCSKVKRLQKARRPHGPVIAASTDHT